jgi:oligoendopeptidase F
MKTPLRAEIPVEHTWDLASIYGAPEAWEATRLEVRERLPHVRGYAGRLGEGPAILAAWLDEYQALMRDAQRLAMYAYLDAATDATNQAAAARVGQANSLAAEVQAAVAFAEPELMALGDETLRRWMAEEPRLEGYAHYFANLRRMRAHIRSAEVEEVLGQIEDPFRTASETHGILANSELRFAPAQGAGQGEGQEAQSYEVTHGTLGALLSHADREVRRTAWESYADAHLAFRNTMANNLAAGVKQDVVRARVRRYGSSLEAALTPDNIPVTVFHNLIEVFKRHLPTWHRYWRLRRKALGVQTLHEWDIKAPLAQEKIVAPYRQAVEWICEGMAPLGEEYVRVLRRGCLEERWVDIYPNKGKRLGAFSYGGPGTHPFIMMSYNDDLFSVSTLAHELGHSLHSYLSWQTQPLIYARYTLFAAEVASNFNQALVRDYLLRTQTDRAFQIGVIEEAMANFHRYFFIMPTLARFELALHERAEQGQPLTADGFGELMAALFAEGYGEDLQMDPARTGVTWAQFSTHLYSNFYVYQYATGIAGAHALARGILDGKEGAVERYLAFLRAGGSRYALDALAAAGVDLQSPQPLEVAFGTLAEYVGRLEELVG